MGFYLNKSHTSMRLTRLLFKRGGTSIGKDHLSFSQQYLKPDGIVIFAVSQFEQEAVKGAILTRIPNLVRRIRDKILVVAPPFIGAYWLYDWMVQENVRLKRKVASDYENDE